MQDIQARIAALKARQDQIASELETELEQSSEQLQRHKQQLQEIREQSAETQELIKFFSNLE